MAAPRSIGNPHGYPDWTQPMIWVLQDGELWPIEQWVAHQGVQKSWQVNWAAAAGTGVDQLVYAVPAGKVLHVVHDIFSADQIGKHKLTLSPSGAVLYYLHLLALTPFLVRSAPPFVVAAGQAVWLTYYNDSAAPGIARHTILGYELDV